MIKDHKLNNINKKNVDTAQVTEILEITKAIASQNTTEVLNIFKRHTYWPNTLNKKLIQALTIYSNDSNIRIKEIILILLNKSADPDTLIDKPGNKKDKITSIILTSMKADVQLIKELIKFKPNINFKDSQNKNALIHLLLSYNGTQENELAECVLLLIHSKININTEDNDGHTALTIASFRGMYNIANMLLKHGGNIDHQVKNDGNNTSLHYAVNTGSINLIKVLLSYKPNLLLLNNHLRSSLDEATIKKYTEIYNILAEEQRKRSLEIKDDKSFRLDTTFSNNHNIYNNQMINNNVSATSSEASPKHKNKNTSFNNNKQNVYNNNNISNDNNFNYNYLQKDGNRFNDNSNSMSIINNNININTSIKNPINNLNMSLNNNNNDNFSNRRVKPTTKLSSNKISDLIQANSINQQHQITERDLKYAKIKYLSETNKIEFKDIIKKKIDISQGNIIKKLEADNYSLLDENSVLKIEINKLYQELRNRDALIQLKDEELKMHSINSYINNSNMLNNSINAGSHSFNIPNHNINSTKQVNNNISRKELLDKKFSSTMYKDDYVIRSLQKDILEFQEYNKELINRINPIQEELLNFIKGAVDETLPDFEVKLYGSHATGLCLSWSDLDTVLLHKKGIGYLVSAPSLHCLYVNLLEKPWIKSIKYIESAVIPIIKITAHDKYNSMQIDISVQDARHYGLKCVDLVKGYMQEFEALEPLLYALKNLLKNANLNDPYTGGLSSYGLILMLVSFLQNQRANNKPIKIKEDFNLGKLFLEFCWYYGVMFDHTKYVINAYPLNGNEMYQEKESLSFLNSLQSTHELIIVDPLSKNNNVARSTHQVSNIKMSFMIAFLVSHEDCECSCHYITSYSYPNICSDNSQLIEHCVLKRIFNSVRRFNMTNIPSDMS